MSTAVRPEVKLSPIGQDEQDLVDLLNGPADHPGCNLVRQLRADYPNETATEILVRYCRQMMAKRAEREAQAAELKALGAAGPALAWLRAQPAPVTARQIREHFKAPQSTVHRWLQGLKQAGKAKDSLPTEVVWTATDRGV
jgi:hypothetical protein